jgi:hypothetical protein
MAVIQEWTAEPLKELRLPEDVLGRLKYKVIVHQINKGGPLVCWCEAFEHTPNMQSLVLKYVIFDSSDRHQQITLVHRRTLYDEILFFGQFTAAVSPI